jgi:hypothetical protein
MIFGIDVNHSGDVTKCKHIKHFATNWISFVCFGKWE